jgi:hypothetical protein
MVAFTHLKVATRRSIMTVVVVNRILEAAFFNRWACRGAAPQEMKM